MNPIANIKSFDLSKLIQRVQPFCVIISPEETDILNLLSEIHLINSLPTHFVLPDRFNKDIYQNNKETDLGNSSLILQIWKNHFEYFCPTNSDQ